MNQQINLYQPIFRREKKVFSAAAMLQLSVLALIGLMAIYGFNYWQLREPLLQLGDLEAQRDRMQAENDKLARLATRQKNVLLEQQVARLEAELETRRAISRALASGTFGDTKGFGDYLEALARRHVEGAWLTEVRIAGGGSSIGLAGNALFPELVPVYIQRLSAERVFSGRAFNVLELERVAEGGSMVAFRLRTRETE